jgi:voltage-gated potassium channel
LTEHAAAAGYPAVTAEPAPEVQELDGRAELILFVLAIAMVPVVILQVSTQDTSLLLAAEVVNTLIWLAFAAEIGYLMWRSRDRAAVLRRRWLDLAIVVLAPPVFVPPEIASLRALRMLRLVRLVAIAARLRYGGARFMGTQGLLYTALIVFLVIFVGGVALYEIEPESVPTVWQGFWFMLATLTTVGYGDITPQTFEGRVIAAFGMVIGLGAFAALAGALTQIFFLADQTASDDRAARLEERVAELERRAR